MIIDMALDAAFRRARAISMMRHYAASADYHYSYTPRQSDAAMMRCHAMFFAD